MKKIPIIFPGLVSFYYEVCSVPGIQGITYVQLVPFLISLPFFILVKLLSKGNYLRFFSLIHIRGLYIHVV